MNYTMGDKAPSTIKEVVKALADMSAHFEASQLELKKGLTKVIEDEIEPVRKSMEFINTSCEELKAELVEMRKELKNIKAENIEIKTENGRLTKDLEEMKKELTDLQQYSRRSNLEIKGLPVVQGENLVSTLQNMACRLQIEVSESDIDVVHRVPSMNKKKESNVVVKFLSRTTRDKLLKAARKQKLNTLQLGFSSSAEESSPVYVNEHLCPAKKVLLGNALKAKKDKGWKYTWVTDGKILMHKADNSHVLHVTCMADLAQVL